jgi:cell wall-associated NlpC family hydrolase
MLGRIQVHRLGQTLLIVALISGCAHQTEDRPAGSRERTVSPSTPKQTIESQGQRIADLARRMIGKPYRYGGEDPAGGFDCSGLVHYTHKTVGVSVPRVSRDQYQRAKTIPLAAAQPGDIIFFSDAVKLSHIAIYVGDGRFVHAPSSGKTVREGRLNTAYYQQHLIGVGRLH